MAGPLLLAMATPGSSSHSEPPFLPAQSTAGQTSGAIHVTLRRAGQRQPQLGVGLLALPRDAGPVSAPALASRGTNWLRPHAAGQDSKPTLLPTGQWASGKLVSAQVPEAPERHQETGAWASGGSGRSPGLRASPPWVPPPTFCISQTAGITAYVTIPPGGSVSQGGHGRGPAQDNVLSSGGPVLLCHRRT